MLICLDYLDLWSIRDKSPCLSKLLACRPSATERQKCGIPWWHVATPTYANMAGLGRSNPDQGLFLAVRGWQPTGLKGPEQHQSSSRFPLGTDSSKGRPLRTAPSVSERGRGKLERARSGLRAPIPAAARVRDPKKQLGPRAAGVDPTHVPSDLGHGLGPRSS